MTTTFDRPETGNYSDDVAASTYKLTGAQYAATKAKFAKINERAVRKGLAGTVALVKVSDEIVHRDGHYEREITARIEGTAPAYAGWSFIARVTRIPGTDAFTIDTIPGLQLDQPIDRKAITAGHCDHCQISRQRKNTYILRDQTGQTRQVGSTCIKDFLGWDGHIAWLDNTTPAEGDGLGAEPLYRVADIILTATADIRQRGFRPSAHDASTREFTLLEQGHYRARPDEARALADFRASITTEDRSRAVDVLAYLTTEEFNDGSEYAANLATLVQAEYVTARHFGILVSAPHAYARHLGELAARTARATSRHVGAVGEKLTTTGTVEKVINCGVYNYSGPTRYLYTWRSTEGNLFKTFTTSKSFEDIDEGDTVTITGTIKDHDTYDGAEQTTLTRCKVTN